MVVHEFISSAGKLELLTHVGLDDFADRLNFLFTVCMLMVFSSITTIKTYFLNPMFCYLPNIVGSHEGQSSYVNNICYTEGTYNVQPENFKIDSQNAQWMEAYKDKKIYYYQWLPFLVGVQGVMFSVPRIVWQLFVNYRAGSDLVQLVRIANEAGRVEGDKREKLVRHVIRQLQMWIYNTREVSKSPMKLPGRRLHSYLSVCLPSKRLGTWLVFVYFCVKCLYVGNLVLQLLVMSKVLQLETLDGHRNKSLLHLTATFGFNLLGELLSGKDWQHTGLFPRSGCCAVKLRQSSSINYLLAQCALPVNMIHEKVFIFLWFWYVTVLALTLFSIALWCFRLLVNARRSHLPRKYLYLAEVLSHKDTDEKAAVDAFVAKFLRHDGALILHMLALNCGDLITTEICAELFRPYKTLYRHQDLRGDGATGAAAAADAADTGGIAVNVSHSSIAMSPGCGNGTAKRRRRRSNSGGDGDGDINCNGKARNLCLVEPSAPLLEEPLAQGLDDSNTSL